MSSAPMGVRIKVCGVTRLQDADAAVRAGVDALGFNFWPRSKRYIAPEAAREIIAALPPFVAPVGVFVNQAPTEIRRALATSGARIIQLHGDEAPDDCRGFPSPIIKAWRVDEDFSAAALARYTVSAYLLDAPSSGYGGSGLRCDWAKLAGLFLPVPLILAGGLTADNVADAIRTVRPYAVDVASGVESGPGVKDAEAIYRFVAAVREGSATLSSASRGRRSRPARSWRRAGRRPNKKRKETSS